MAHQFEDEGPDREASRAAGPHGSALLERVTALILCLALLGGAWDVSRELGRTARVLIDMTAQWFELQSLADRLAEWRTREGGVTVEELDQILELMSGSYTSDRWGTPYRLALPDERVGPGEDLSGLVVLSAGPDLLFGTVDDLACEAWSKSLEETRTR